MALVLKAGRGKSPPLSLYSSLPREGWGDEKEEGGREGQWGEGG